MKKVQEKRKKGRERKSIDLPAYEDAQINEISKEFFPGRIFKKGKGWTCPLCYRPYHKEPGPFTYGLTVRRNERVVSVWAQALNCCRCEQHFPSEKIKGRKIEEADFNSILARIFYPK